MPSGGKSPTRFPLCSEELERGCFQSPLSRQKVRFKRLNILNKCLLSIFFPFYLKHLYTSAYA